MRRSIPVLTLLSASLLFTGGTYQAEEAPPTVVKRYSPSCGYTIIEYGKGVDCNGDTVTIARKNGAQVIVNS